jgi:hypothetical protein
MSHQQRTTQNHYERATNESYKNKGKLKHMGITVRNQTALTVYPPNSLLAEKFNYAYDFLCHEWLIKGIL